MAVAQHSAARWIWYPEAGELDARNQTRYFRRSFTLADRPRTAVLWIQTDDRGAYWLNGQRLARAAHHRGGCAGYQVAALLRPGRNVLAVEALNVAGIGGVIARLEVTTPDGKTQVVCSDRSWRAAREVSGDWAGVEFADATWPTARELGDAFIKPWSEYAGYSTAAVVTADEAARRQAAIAAMLAPPEELAAERPTQARLVYRNGSPAVVIDGQARPAVFYRGTIDPLTDQGRRQIGNFAAAGVHLFLPGLRLDQFWKGPDDYDFSAVDNELRGFLTADRHAYLIAQVRLIPPNWWMAAHETEYVGYAKTDRLDASDEAQNVKRASPASAVWLRDTAAAWQALVRHIEGRPWGKRVIGWQPEYGIYGEWHYFGSWSNQMPDTGAAMTARFHDWLASRYGSEAALRSAWADPAIRFATAAVPGVAARESGAILSLRDPQREQAVIDYYRCHQQVLADCLEAFGGIVRRATGGRCLHGAYYGYLFGVTPQAQGGHLELERLLRSPQMDFFAAPFSYAYRLMGQDGRLRSPAAAFRCAGKVHMLEGDIRTHLHSRNEHGRAQNLQQSLAAVRREFTTALTEGTAFWYVDFGPSLQGGWFDDPAIMAEVTRLQRLATEMLQRPRRAVAEVALVCDLQSAYLLSDGEGMQTAARLLENVGTELYHSGAPLDVLFLEQLAHTDLSRYKLLVFLNTLAMGDAAAAQAARLRAAGQHTILWLWLPGLIGPRGVDVARASRVTGFELELLRRRVPGRLELLASGSPLTAAIPAEDVFRLHETRCVPLADVNRPDAWLNPRSAAFMQRYFRQHALAPDGAGIRWTLDTDYRWSDIHLRGPIETCDGLAIELKPDRHWGQLRFQLSLVDRQGAEFITGEEGFDDDRPARRLFPIAGLTNAPWSKLKPARPAWPAQALKLILSGTAHVGPVRLDIRQVARVWGQVEKFQRRTCGDGIPFGPALAARSGQALGVVPRTHDCLLAASPDGRNVLCSMPSVPRELLGALLDRAGVHRYLRNPADVVRADSQLLVVHTRDGGQREIRLPRSVRLRDALSGQLVGQGTCIPLTLPPASTSIWKIEQEASGTPLKLGN
jgi:hypothetical protein